VATFFVVAVVCHRELANSRPAPLHLTEFYLWMSFGGMIGGLFNSLLAPQVFTGILEYPLVLAAAALIRPSPGYRQSQVESWRQLVAVPACVALFSIAMWAIGALPPELSIGALLLTLATLLAAGYVAANRTLPFGVMAMLFVFVIAFVRPASSGTVLLAARSFFGVHRVVDAADHTYHTLQHGSTTHGREQMSTRDECRPTAYFHPSSPIGELMAARQGHLREVAVVGLGTGALACYAEPGRSWTFYEIDPIVEQIARNPRYFTYLQNTPGNVNVVLGDARISLQRPSVGRYDLIVLDAFSSDAIPIHLLTREAIQLYFSRLRSDGVVAVHISNRYLNLEPILAALAEHDGLHAITKVDDQFTDSETRLGKFASHWVMLAANRDSLVGLVNSPGWRAAQSAGSRRVWTDDYSNIVQAIRR
jgi:spermidine synthase